MQLFQFFLARLRKDTITALDDKVVIHCKSPFAEYEYEYNYEDLSTNLIKGKIGDGGWDAAALLFFCLTMIVDVFARFLFNFKGWAIEASGFTLAIVLFCLKFIKYDFVNISTIRDDNAFLIKVSGKDHKFREEFVQHLLAKIKEAKSKSK